MRRLIKNKYVILKPGFNPGFFISKILRYRLLLQLYLVFKGMQILFVLFFSLHVSATSKDCSEWFSEWKLSAENKNCELKCNTTPKNLVGAFCDCKELCKARDSDSLATLVFYPGLSQIEKELIIKDPKSSLKAFINKKLAEKIADKYFSNGGHNDESDALRHLFGLGF